MMVARIHRRGLRGTLRPHVTATAPFAPPTSGSLAGAACRGVDPDLFFPEPDPDALGPEWECAFEFAVRRAKMICAGCPVRLLCLAGALERNEPEGIFGGLDAAERRRLKRSRQNGQSRRRCRERSAAEAGLWGAA